jgi:hypothetical protein
VAGKDRFIVPVNFTVEAEDGERAESELKDWLDGFKQDSPKETDAFWSRLDFMVWPAIGLSGQEKAGAA